MLHNICRPGASAWTNIHRRLWPPFCYTINRKQGYNARHTLSCIPLHILKFIIFRSKDLLNLRHCEEWGGKQNEEKLFVDGFGRKWKKKSSMWRHWNFERTLVLFGKKKQCDTTYTQQSDVIEKLQGESRKEEREKAVSSNLNKR